MPYVSFRSLCNPSNIPWTSSTTVSPLQRPLVVIVIRFGRRAFGLDFIRPLQKALRMALCVNTELLAEGFNV